MARRWTAAEDRQLTAMYADGLPLAVIAGHLGRSADALVARRAALGVAPRRPARAWSPRLDAIIRASAQAGVPARVVAERLGLTIDAVRWRRRALTPARPAARPYRVDEDDALRALVADGGRFEDLAVRLGRSAQALRLRARILGLLGSQRRWRWTAEEDRLLRAGYAAGLTCVAIAAELPCARSAEAVAARARNLGLATYARLWTAADDERLRALSRAGASLEDAAQHLQRTPQALRRRARKLGVAAPVRRARANDGRPWTEREDALLRATPAANPGALAKALGRSDHAITSRRRKLGLREGRERSAHHRLPATGPLTAGEARLLERELAHGGARRRLAVAERLDRSPATLTRVADHTAGAQPAKGTAAPTAPTPNDSSQPPRQARRPAAGTPPSRRATGTSVATQRIGRMS